MLNPSHLIGKPLVVYVEGTRHEIGTITNAKIDSGRLFTSADLDLEAEVPTVDLPAPEENR